MQNIASRLFSFALLAMFVESTGCIKPRTVADSGQLEFVASNTLYPMNTMVATCDEAGDGIGGFGSWRDGGARKHAGCDLYNNVRQPIYAVEDGIVLDSAYDFYCDTDALEIQHGDRVIRYGEIQRGSADEIGMVPGKRVKKGEMIARVGLLSCYYQPMLHLEMYAGTADGPLTDRSRRPFERRPDLLNPTQMLMGAKTEARLAGGSTRVNRSCNQDELTLCRKNGGGVECYSQWGCPFPGGGAGCNKVQLLTCLDYNGGDPCFPKWNCTDQRKP